MRCDPQRAYTVAPALMGQGGARDIMCEWLLRLRREDPWMLPYLRVMVHDEIVTTCPEDEADRVKAALQAAMTWVWRGVPILCEISGPGPSWGAVSAKIKHDQDERKIVMITCGFCTRPAVWRWKPAQPPAEYNQFLCDDHAAKVDLDELEELGAR